MTNRQADNILYNIENTMSIMDKHGWDEETIKYNEEIIEALKLGRKALYRMIPFEPDWEGDGYDPDGNMIYKPYCPECRHVLEEDEDDICPNCGQWIKWGGE